jgi:sulfate/thiosulfate-binding protein
MSSRRSHFGRLSAGLTAVLLLVAIAVLAGCGSSSDSGSSGSGGKVKLAIVAYSTPAEVFAKQIAAFQQTPAGKGVTFSQSYGASGDQSRAVVSGLPADVVNFSIKPDMDRVVASGQVSANWAATPTQGVTSDSVVVFATRPGNPKHITTWADLTKPGVQIVSANPVSSGGARWGFAAAYGQAIRSGQTPAQADAYLAALLKNVVVQSSSAREALQTFTAGKGDVLLTYENEAITAQQAGQKLAYTIPESTLLIQTPFAVTTKTKHPAQAKAFQAFLLSTAGQKIYAASGYRPVDKALADPKRFPIPKGLFTMAQLGGWDKINPLLFGDNGVVTKINAQNGVGG